MSTGVASARIAPRPERRPACSAVAGEAVLSACLPAGIVSLLHGQGKGRDIRMIAFRPRHSYNVCDMTLQSPAPTPVGRCRPAAPVRRRAGMRQSGGSVPYLLCRLLFWLLAVGMASELPLGSSWPESSRSAREIDLRDSLLAAAPAVADDDDEADPAQDIAQGVADICDEGGLPHLERLARCRLAFLVGGDRFEAAPVRLSTARPSARAPPVPALG